MISTRFGAEVSISPSVRQVKGERYATNLQKALTPELKTQFQNLHTNVIGIQVDNPKNIPVYKDGLSSLAGSFLSLISGGVYRYTPIDHYEFNPNTRVLVNVEGPRKGTYQTSHVLFSDRKIPTLSTSLPFKLQKWGNALITKAINLKVPSIEDFTQELEKALVKAQELSSRHLPQKRAATH